MHRYHLWFDHRPGVRDTDLARALHALLAHHREAGRLREYAVERRRLGLGPRELGEWHVVAVARELSALDAVFDEAASRGTGAEALHAAVWGKLANVRTVLCREVADPALGGPPPAVAGGHEVA